LQPLAGRRFWIAGIGGAGMSGYAVLAKAWGAEVSGWDRYETPYLEHVRAAGIPVTVAPDAPSSPEGAEAVVSTAFAGSIPGKSRAELLAELVSLQDAIVVAGAHGKTTTAAMIAFALDRLGNEPSFLLGGEVAQLGGNARAGSGWLVVEGDESDRTVAALPAKIAVVTNIDLDHHTTFSSAAEVEELLEGWLERQSVPVVIRGRELGPAEVELGLPGEHNRRNAACALAVLEAAGFDRAEAAAALAEFRGVRRRFELRGERGGVRVFDDYAHHPSEVAATLAAARELAEGGRTLVLFQPHLYSRTLHLAHELAGALVAADLAAVTDVYPAREEALEGVSGKLVVDRLCELRPGMAVGWTPGVEDGARLVADRARAGDVLLTVGAGDVDSAIPWILERLPP
jgi:UDP-N-acetylmuramate--alanine ligase